MGRELRADYSQQWLLPPSLEDWVASDHPARFIRDFVDLLDLSSLGIAGRPSEEGRPCYAPDLLLKIWLFGYWEGIRSSRALERACRNQVALIWLAGRHEPDHNTLWRFWHSHRACLKGLFRQSVQVAVHAGEVGWILHAVDGTKIRSAASKESAWHKADLESLLNRLDAYIDELSSALESDTTGDEAGYRLSEPLQEAHARKEAIRTALAQLEREELSRIQPHDPQARMMKTREGTHWCYNAQAVVDQDSGLIVAQEVHCEANDSHLLTPMIDNVVETTGNAAQTTVADAGYHSGSQLTQSRERNYGVVVATKPTGRGNESPYHISQFQYDADNDLFICPQGHAMNFTSTAYKQTPHCEVRRYRTTACRDCPVRGECCAGKARIIEKSPYYEAAKENEKRVSEPPARALLRKRMGLIEPVFGFIKENMKFRRWSMYGQENVSAQWSMICLTYNLKKLFRMWKGNNGPTTEFSRAI